MDRYSVITEKNPREIVLLKGAPCRWGKCTFCDYIADNCDNAAENYRLNRSVLRRVTGEYGALEAINSGSVFELDTETLGLIRRTVTEKGIQKLYFECHYSYRNRLSEIKSLFDIPVIFKCGIETFDDDFRNRVLKKGIVFRDVNEIKKYFDSICIMVGIAGQTKEMIARDIRILTEHFEYGCVNVYCNNSTPVKQDDALIAWFRDTYGTLAAYPNIDVLYHNTDFGVGDTQ